jgi:hypothetical protein
MGKALLHGFERNLRHGRWSRKIGVTHLQANQLASAGFERQDAICHRDGRGLSKSIELNVEALHGYLTTNAAVYQHHSHLVNLREVLYNQAK